MAKITRHRHKGYEVTVSYSTRNSLFEIILPKDLKAYGDKTRGSTEAEVKSKFDNLVELYIKEGAKRDKVIAIEIETADDGFFCDDEFKRAGGVSSFLHIQYAIVEAVTINGDEILQYKEALGTSKRRLHNNQDRTIPWTQEREDFLKQVTAGLQGIAEKVDAFFKVEGLPIRIDSAKIPLISNPRK